MEKNIGTQDSHMRLVAGALIVLFALFFVENPTVQIILAVISAILAGTSFLNVCLLYKLFGMNTCEADFTAKSLDTETKEESKTSVEEVDDEEPKQDS